MSFSSITIAAPQGRSGKTLVSIGICAALKRRGLAVQPFKKGPDYIDPSWLSAAAGRGCRNLDSVLMPEKTLVASFMRACKGADIALMEGAMGLYDSLDQDGRGSTAHLAKLLGSPVILVVNAARMTRSIAAMVRGYQHFEPEIQVAGVILNRVAGIRHERKLREAVERYCGIPVVGSIPQDSEMSISERHLGLIPFPEGDQTNSMIDRIRLKLEPYLALDEIAALAGECGGITEETSSVYAGKFPRARIGVIRDRAFTFYYLDNLEALSRTGAELVFINSLKDRLPEVDGLYIGGGFPEFFAEELEANQGLRRDIAKAAEDGLPVYAECAGLIYLCRSIKRNNRSYEMTGIIPADIEISSRPQGHGYVEVEVTGENPFFKKGSVFKGHEFHHSKLSDSGGLGYAFSMRRGRGVDGSGDGIVYKNVFAAYTHLHALGTPEWAEVFVALASVRAGAGHAFQSKARAMRRELSSL